MTDKPTTKTTTTRTPEADDPHARLLVRLIRTLLADQTFASLADLTEAVKFQCARLRIRITADDVNAAYALIASNRPLATATRPRRPFVRDGVSADLSRSEAAHRVKELLDEATRRLEGR